MIQAEAQLSKLSQAEINAKFKNEDNVAKNRNKFPLKASKSEHNHSK